jgi:hypothetical protein
MKQLMKQRTLKMAVRKRIALIAHDKWKPSTCGRSGITAHRRKPFDARAAGKRAEITEVG